MATDHFHCRCLELAAAAPEPKQQKMFLRMARSFEVDAALLAMSRSIIAESRRLLATSSSGRANNTGQDDLLTDSAQKSLRAGDCWRGLNFHLQLCIATSRHMASRRWRPPHRLRHMLRFVLRPIAIPAALSVHVFQDGMRFSWTVCSPSEEILGRGTAETELKARMDAFCAGMTYLAWTKNRSPSGDASLH